MNTHNGQVVWITGASSGIGEALSYAFAAKGAKLVLSARRVAELERVRMHCAPGSEILILEMDLSDAASLPSKVKWVLDKFSRIDILVNNAGFSQRSFAKDTDPGVYRKIMEVNFFGTVALSNLVLAHFLERKEGRFVVISSLAGKIGLPLRTAYCGSKFALEGYYSALRTETWRTPIRFLMVRPGSVKTNIAQHALVGDGSNFNKPDAFIEKGMSPERVAAQVLRAIDRNKKEIVTGSFAEKMALILNKWLPALVFNATKKIIP